MFSSYSIISFDSYGNIVRIELTQKYTANDVVHSKEFGTCQGKGSPPRQNLKRLEDCTETNSRKDKDGYFCVAV
jgi:hypothetical protein